MDNDGLTQYMRIAISVAERIAAGELREGEKISGRSKLSSEYEVSPETVRRAIQLLSDMRVVAVKEQSGVYVLSADNAKRYLQNFENRADLMSKRRKLRELIEEKEALNRRMGELCQSILQATGATVAAIRRGTTDILSPGPYAELYAGDTVIFVGEKKAKEAVERFLNTEQETGSGKGP